MIEEVEVQAAGPPTMKNIDKQVSPTGNSPKSMAQKLDDIEPKKAEPEKPVESPAKMLQKVESDSEGLQEVNELETEYQKLLDHSFEL